jgi:hypothetical protein
MKNLEKKQVKEIIKLILDKMKITDSSFVANTYFVGTSDKDFEKKFMKNMAFGINDYLVSQKLDPKEYNRSITYTVTNTENNYVITY